MAEERTINLNVNTKGAQKNVNDLEKAVEGVNNEVKDTGASTEAMGNTVDKATGGAVSKFKAFKGGLTSVIASFKSLRIAILATGIGALLIAVTSLGQAFTRSEEGQNKFAKILGVIGSVTGNLLDLLADLGENIISVFEDPKQALIDFKNLLVENVTNRFKAILDTVGFLGSAIKKVFSRDFKGALDDAKKAGSSFVDSFTGVENSIDKATNAVKEFGKEVAKDAANAAKIADLRAEADRLDRKLIVDRAKADRDRATLLEKSINKEKFSVQERIKFLQEAADLEEKITNQEIEAAQKRLEAQQAENALGKSTKEDKQKEAELEAQLIQLETAKLTKQKEVTSQIIAFKAEEAAALKAIADQKAAEDKERADKIAAENKERKDKEEKEEKERNERKILEDKAVQDAELDIKNASLDAATAGFSILASFDKKNKKLQAATLIASNAVGIAKNIINTNAANARITAEAGLAAPPLILANNIRMITGIASSVAATTKGLAALKSGGSATGGGGGAAGGGSTPPSFNIVGATETSQLAQAVGGQTQQPVQAYVVANDITTAQSLENNIVEGATIGS